MKPPVYEHRAERYDRAVRRLERLGLARLRAAVCRELPADARLLEVGAGTGLNFRHYPPDVRGAAVELSFEMLHRARWKAERPAHVALVQARAESLPFADDSFDAALATLERI